MPQTDCPLLYNLTPWIYGLRQRSAYVQYATGLTGAGGNNEVRSIFPYQGSSADGSKDILFAATMAGIWNAGTAIQVATYGTQTGDAGYGTCVVFNTSADRFIVATDEVNGYWLYKESTNAWAQIAMGGGGTQISGVDPATFVHVTVFKNRLWFTQKNSTLAWYLGTNAIYGAATSFDFGARFAHGGDLRGLYNWSYDGGGSGIDTLLVGLSSGGDVAVYQGTDPTTAASFSLKNTWFVGAVPPGRKLATEYGGDLLVLSTLGVIPLSKLTMGYTVMDSAQHSTFKISTILAKAMNDYGLKKGWGIYLCPIDNTLLVNVPTGFPTSNVPAFQFAMSLSTRGWSQYGHDTSTTCVGYPMLCGANWNGGTKTSDTQYNSYFFGDGNGKVYYLRSNTSASTKDLGTTYVECEIVHSSQDMGGTHQKQIVDLKPHILTRISQSVFDSSTVLSVAARYNYDETELATIANVTPTETFTTNFVDVAPRRGAIGMGSRVSVCVRFRAVGPTFYVGTDVLYQDGGYS